MTDRGMILFAMTLALLQGCAICITRVAIEGEDGDLSTAVLKGEAAWAGGEVGDDE